MLSCKWLGIKLSSPFVLASLTLFSKPDIDEHVRFFSKAASYGIGAIILPSINPLRKNMQTGYPHVRVAPVDTGLTEDEYMGFAVLGRTDNILPVDYGIELANESVKIGVPIIASIANVGKKSDFIETIKQIRQVDGIAGLELNFSCPSVKNGLAITEGLLSEIHSLCDSLSLSIKLAPQHNYQEVLKYSRFFNGITCSNAQRGLMPPTLHLDNPSPFADCEIWRPTGVYGPQEKLFTYHRIWEVRTGFLPQDIDLSSVGGFVTSEDAIKALMLGSNTVQISSAIFWKSLKIIKKFNDCLISFLKENDLTLDSLRGMALRSIVDGEQPLVNQRPNRIASTQNCQNCSECQCVDCGCYAFSKIRNSPAVINADLCNGCGWCSVLCKRVLIESRP